MAKSNAVFEEEKKDIVARSDWVVRFLHGSDCKESARKAGEWGSIPGLGWSPEKGNGYPLQYSCLEISMGRGAWWAAVHGVAQSRTQLSD